MRGKDLTININTCQYPSITDYIYDSQFDEVVITSCFINAGDEDVQVWLELPPKYYNLIEKDVLEYHYSK